MKIYTKRCTSNNVRPVSEDFLCLHFVVEQFQDMTWERKNVVKQKYWTKNMAVQIPILILTFVYFANSLLYLL